LKASKLRRIYWKAKRKKTLTNELLANQKNYESLLIRAQVQATLAEMLFWVNLTADETLKTL
jgi:hypothetical protein